MPKNPLLEAFLENELDTERNEGENPLCRPTSQEETVASKTSQSIKLIWRYGLLFATVCCIAVLCYPAARNFLTEENIGSTTSHHELKRVTHAPSATGDGIQVLPREVASYLHRTSFHFQPEKNWMNDPNGPMYYKGYYHFFYQYNPNGAVWGDIVWGHAVSTDLIHWLYLDIALVPDQWYDAYGVWSGSVTLREDGVPIIIYTGASNAGEQTQNVAYPGDPSDPLLRRWVKDQENPILRSPPGINIKDFRDPTTAWKDVDGNWLMTVGAKKQKTGLALLYKSVDLKHWELQENVLHSVESTGMWECVDFFPVAVQGHHGLETYTAAPTVKYVLKASLDDTRHDHYALGSYNVMSKTFHPDDPTRDTGIGLRYDYGKFYASKSFFDPAQQRRILWGWVNESDSEVADIAKGWSSVQAIPRTVFYDDKTKNNLIQVPVEEVKELRGARVSERDVKLVPGGLVQVKGASGGQLDIEVVFDYPNITKLSLDGGQMDDGDHFDCSQGGAAHRGVFGPFGLLVLADENFQERTAVFFYVSYSKEGKWRTRFCSDQTRSSLLPDVDTTVYGSFVEVLPSEDFLSLRVLVDRSIVESFVQGGRMVITSRVYPTMATDQAAHLYLFNNATTSINVRNIDAWQMHSVPMHAI
ncbi:hypothetical protein KC19_7G104500 [Ceratodon purpureus]|uniref:Beta-fructofuranosidase n=1 Tax=Ceratodon purpureus TaxID=3225 RepID=A0A8T0H708_CERPU|nr:hypothetical protein KC19_7G104500 [Ceratodon purpureus]